MKTIAMITAFLLTFVAGQAFGQTPKCDALTAENKSIAQTALKEIQAYGCCTDSIANCLAKHNDACRIPNLLADDICSQISKGKKSSEIKESIAQRTKMMSADAKVYTIDIKPEHLWGNPEAKVVLSVYLCGRCPYCSRHVPLLIHTLEQSLLKDKVAVNLRYFPIKSHDNSTPAALAIEAAARMGKAWPYLIKSYEQFDAFTLNKITVWAKELDLDNDAFTNYMKDPEVRKTVADSKKEGLVNGVTTTPTLFLNGRRIEGVFDIDSVMSMLEELVMRNE